jgi:hypothetical protein
MNEDVIDMAWLIANQIYKMFPTYSDLSSIRISRVTRKLLSKSYLHRAKQKLEDIKAIDLTSSIPE